MKCEDFGKYLDNYENLTEQEKIDMNEHAANCDACKAELDFFLSMISAAKSLPKIEPPSDFMDKLNARLDAEDKRVVSASGIMSHLRRYGTRYAALAACLALVAVITVNRSLLTDKMVDTPDGVILEETTLPDAMAQDDGQSDVLTENDLPVPADDAHSDIAPVANSNNAASASQQNSTATGNKSVGTTSTSAESKTAAAKGSTTGNVTAENTRSVPAGTTGTVSETAETISEAVNVPVSEKTETPAVIATPKNERNSDIGNTEPAPMNITAENNTRSITNANEAYTRNTHNEGYSIALASIVNIHDAPETYDLRAEEVSESLKTSQVQTNYSLASESEIAHGMYYKLNKDGIPIESATAVGSIKFSYDDKERAMEVINHYDVDKQDNVYTTDSVNLTLILSKLRSEGIPYTDYTIDETGEVKFQVQFN